ncbi:ribonuclease D [Mycolicibacterium conceptionense]|uniref:Ribonuclease D n=1 Tax=Mycolicibacterium conceptionense TaxID=451644 RepID=A0A0U1DT02_9MYCO|nr:ribonuclease D [Mycolicibacterium conceptionense]
MVRRLCWDWHPVADVATAVEEFLVEANVRPWQRELTVPVLTKRSARPSDAHPLTWSMWARK